jgi:hypothetical protein
MGVKTHFGGQKERNHMCLYGFPRSKISVSKRQLTTPFIDQIIDECVGGEIFSFMDGFSGYIQIQIRPEDQHKTMFIYPWGSFTYKNMPFVLKIMELCSSGPYLSLSNI